MGKTRFNGLFQLGRIPNLSFTTMQYNGTVPTERLFFVILSCTLPVTILFLDEIGGGK